MTTLDYSPCHRNDEFVQLGKDDIDKCARYGLKLAQRAEERCYKKTIGETADSATLARGHAIGAVAEGALCRHFGWPIRFDPNSFNAPDLPGSIQVRAITRDYRPLRVKTRDKPHWRVVGVVIVRGREREEYRLPGWYYAGEAQAHPEWAEPWFDGPPVFMVPQEHLRPLSELRETVRAEGHDIPVEPGFVGYDREGHFLHYCRCGRWGLISEGTELLKDRLGTWYCAQHRPRLSADAGR
jgi:hypothetical protein